jgi:hypothetical protein
VSKLFADDDSIVTAIVRRGSENEEHATDEEGVVEFFGAPAADVDLTQVGSCVVGLTCGTVETGVYCP